MTDDKTFSTLAVHAGEDRRKPYGALTMPIVQTSTFTFEDTTEIMEFMRGKAAGRPDMRDEYGRYSNPTQTVLERKIATLERGDQCLIFASGMCALTSTLAALLAQGDHFILVQGVYRRTRDFALNVLPRWGIQVSEAPLNNPAALTAALRPNTRLILAETPTNPYLRILDLRKLVEAARPRGILTALDSTFATPINLRPLEWGVDLVIHSVTKYLAGHNDVICGAVVGFREVIDRVKEFRGILGGVAGPQEAYLALRGFKTLGLRLKRQNENGQLVAEFLERHPAVGRVFYPGLPSHPDHAVARRLMNGFGGVVSFEIKGDIEKTGRFIDRLRLPYLGPTLGGVESIAQQQALFISLDPAERQASGISDNLVRYALGIEDARDIIADLDQALASL
jgi:cystathionine gamma-synthase